MNAINRDASVVRQTATRMPVIFAVLHAAFLVASLGAVPIRAPGARIPNPFGPDEASRNFVLNNPEAVRVTAFLQLASAMCLAALGAAIDSRQNPFVCLASHSGGQRRRICPAGNLGIVRVGPCIAGRG